MWRGTDKKSGELSSRSFGLPCEALTAMLLLVYATPSVRVYFYSVPLYVLSKITNEIKALIKLQFPWETL
jgi:hypothetical protein